jgi:hypothetical protein
MSDNPISDAHATVKSVTKLLDRLEAQVAQAKLFAAQFDEQKAAREQALAEHQRAVDSLVGQLADERAEHANKLAAAEAEHSRNLAELSAAQAAEHAAKSDALSRREANLVTAQKEFLADQEKLIAAQRWLDHQKADLRNRYSGAA